MNLLLYVSCVFVLWVVNVSAQKPFTGSCCEDYCYDLDGEKVQSRHFATKTAYQIVKGTDSNRQYVVPNCNPVKFWFLSRHGTRLPDTDEIKKLRELSDLRDEIIDNYEKRHSKPDTGAMCNEDLELLQHWTWNPNVTNQYAQYLTVQGWDDIKYLALTYQSAFPNVLDNIYSKEKFEFRHTNKQRTEASYKAFVEGLFGENAYEHITLPPPQDKDILLKPYKMCEAWKRNSKYVEEDPISERSKYRNSPVYQQMLKDVSQRLGFKFALKSSQVELMWDMCRYDLSWQLDRPSAWCSAFTATHINILEYAVDLKDYYEEGYGNDINSAIPCAAMKDLLATLDSKNQPQVKAYFTHSSMLLLMLTALGAVRDRDALRADNYQQMNRRKFKTSELSPFAANLAVIKYECPNDNERNKIMFFINQKPLDFEWCNVGLCNWSEVRRRFAKYEAAECSTYFCGTSSAMRMATIGSATAMATIIAMTFLLVKVVFT